MNDRVGTQPEELAAARAWFEAALAALRAVPQPALRAQIHCLKQGWGKLVHGRTVAYQPLCLHGQVYATGFGTHAESAIRVVLPRPGQRLQALAGVDDNADTRQHAQPLVFAVEVAGREVWRSGPQRSESPPAAVDVALGGACEFLLLVTGPITYAHADWADVQVTLDNGTTIALGEPPRPAPCFSFVYDDQPSAELLPSWQLAEEHPPAGGGVAVHRLTRTDPRTGLHVTVEFKEYAAFPVIEWAVRLKNTGCCDTPILENLLSLGLVVPGLGGYLNYHRGDYNTADSYEPQRAKLGLGCELAFAPEGGRPTNRAFPYFNLELPDGESGIIIVVGWSGQWAARFTADEPELRITAGQELTHFTLHPGEEARTPVSVLLFWRVDRVRAQNLWRRWMLAHNVPRPGGQLPPPMQVFCSGGFFPGLKVSAASERQFIDALAQEEIKPDYWWMDAGWYPCEPAWSQVGTWEPDPERFPNGIRAVSDYVHQRGMKLVLWFEPERVRPGTWLHRTHPDWLLTTTPRAAGPPADTALLNLGHPEAWHWLVNHVDRFLTQQGVDLYRQDFNLDPLPYWRANDAPDRQGLTEMRHVEGYLAFWDELHRRHPGLLIDSCASGGRRNDLETLRRALPLLRSDYQSFSGDPGYAPGNQGHTYGLSSWIPFYGQGAYYNPDQLVYAVRSHFSPAFGLCADVRQAGVDWGAIRRLLADWRAIADGFLGDFYPLTHYSLDAAAWMAWQFHRPDREDGFVQVFRHAASPYEAASFPLRGLRPEAVYLVTDLDGAAPPTAMSGRQLLEQGLPVRMGRGPRAVILTYRLLDTCPGEHN